MFETWLFASLPLWTLDAAQGRKSKSKEVTEPQPTAARKVDSAARRLVRWPGCQFESLPLVMGSPTHSKQHAHLP